MFQNRSSRRWLAVCMLLVLPGCASPQRTPVDVNILAINDFHGYIEANPFRYPDPTAPDGVRTVNAGGIATLGGMLDTFREQDPQLLFISAGDLVGGSPPISAMWADEPTIEAFTMMGLKLSALGNHELDAGKEELLRQIRGGCESVRKDKACTFKANFSGAGFPYLAANVIDTQTGNSLLPAYRIEEVHGVKVAFVGAVLRDVASVVRPSGMEGLKVTDEAEAINKLIPELDKQGVNAIVAVIHQGGSTPEPFDKPDCQHLQGDIVDIAQRLSPKVDVLVSAHTHQGYLCRVGRLTVTQGDSYGHVLTHLTLSVMPGEHQVTVVKAENLIADPKRYVADPKLAALQAEIESQSRKILQKPIARIQGKRIGHETNQAGEAQAGDLIADAQLAAVKPMGAQVAFMNPGGIRGDFMLEPGQTYLTYSQVASIQPFNNSLILLTLTGAQLQELLNQQWRKDGGFSPLQVSSSFSYRWDAGRPTDDRVVPGSMRIEGKPVDAEQLYGVVVNDFLAEGGDGFSVLKDAKTHRDTGISDLEALIAHLTALDEAGTPAGMAQSERIVRVDKAL
ncbi:bifunctional metallophosphatase/5'-nucleotidase [Phytohalomonas tamaricis]|uniref:bifunctional metallophosphatase/5'-nucleotidase n=1 Tax=Phytohalomonas tamaricis TaxID=2081032 RepID=UPI000D0BD3A1|nr:bifunctional metallophosphatase/5'-nucleotidase [Phytohalomonas tamaricis]